MPNSIDKETYEQAKQELPDIDRLSERTDRLRPDIISIKFKPESNFPIAGSCFQDAGRTLREARYALLEALAHKIWYREKINPANEAAAVFFGRFYADDAALRLYAAAEHLAKAAVYIFDIQDEQIKSERRGKSSRFKTVRNVLMKPENQAHPSTIAIDHLYNSKEWKDTISYRNAWVHQQPPLVTGLGPAFKRKPRWTESKTGKSRTLVIGSGDHAEYSLDDLLKFILPALMQFAETLTQVTNFYISELVHQGFSITEAGISCQLLTLDSPATPC